MDRKDVINPFEEAIKFLDHAIASYLEVLHEEESIVGKSANSSKSDF